MEALETIATRLSVRHYTNQPVDEAQLQLILKAGLEAPSARNIRPFRIQVITKREALNYLASQQPAKRMLQDAPVAILVLGDRDLQHKECYRQQDCSALTQNILLAAHALKLGTCWLGIETDGDFEKSVATYFDLPANLQPITLIALGHPQGDERPKTNRFEGDKITYIR